MWVLTILALAEFHLQCQGATLDYHAYTYGQPSYGTSLQDYGSYYNSGYPYANPGYNSYYSAYVGDSYVSRVRCRRYACTNSYNHPCCYTSQAPPPPAAPCPTQCPVSCPTQCSVPCPAPCPPPAPVPCPVPCPTPVPCPIPCPAPPQVQCTNPCPAPSAPCTNPCPAPSAPCPATSTCPVTGGTCPTQTAACPAYGRRRRNAQRKCHFNAHCPNDSTCCSDNCTNGSVCKRTSPQNRQISTALAPASYFTKVDVTVIMTSGCSTSAWFVQTQLMPVLQYLHPYINAELVAHGILHQDGSCQYGSSDCLGNMLIACTVKYIQEQTAVVNFTACLMQHTSVLQGHSLQNVLAVARQCNDRSPSTAYLWQYIHNCAVGTEGSSLFQAAGQRQLSIVGQIQQLPAIVLNGVLSLDKSSELGYFSYMVCQMLQDIPYARTTCQQVFGHA